MKTSYQIIGLVDALEKQAGQKGEPGVWDHISNWIYRNPEWASSIAGGLVGGGIGAATGKPGTGLGRFLIGALLGGGAGYGAGYLGRNKIQSWLDPQRYAKARDIESKEKTWLTDAISKGQVDPNNPEVIRLAKHHGIDISKLAPSGGQQQPDPNAQQQNTQSAPEQQTQQNPGGGTANAEGVRKVKEEIQREAQDAMQSTNRNSNQPIVPPAGTNTPANNPTNFRTPTITMPEMDITPSWYTPANNPINWRASDRKPGQR